MIADGDQERWCGLLGLWGFDGGAGGIEGRWMRLAAMIWMTVAAPGLIFSDFAVAPAGLAGRTGGSGMLRFFCQSKCRRQKFRFHRSQSVLPTIAGLRSLFHQAID